MPPAVTRSVIPLFPCPHRADSLRRGAALTASRQDSPALERLRDTLLSYNAEHRTSADRLKAAFNGAGLKVACEQYQ
jgi:hypothetical protein